jgi:hypothetical protein
MKIIRHIIEQPFVFSTGLAALVHSTWSLGTLFAGKEPQPQFQAAWWAWVIPAFLIAFAMDVGQIVTSAEIREGNRSRTKYLTFAVFALATYYLQWLYISHHMPLLDLADGVRGEWSGITTLIRDAAIWIIPALLPLSTLLYTFSGGQEKLATHESLPAVPLKIVERVEQALPDMTPQLLPLIQDGEKSIVTCPACGVWRKEYDNPTSAARGLATHQSKHCAALHPDQNRVLNGAHE